MAFHHLTDLIALSPNQGVALLVCLAASLIWAPLVLAGALRVSRRRGPAQTDRIWTAALLIAVAPCLAAPILAASNVSLRPTAIAAVERLADAASSAIAETGRRSAEPAATLTDVEALESEIFSRQGESFTPIDLSTLNEAERTATPFQIGSIQASRPESAPPPEPFTAEKALASIAMLYVYGLLLAFSLWAFRQGVFAIAIAGGEPLRRAAPGRAAAIEADADAWRDRLGVAAKPRFIVSPHISSVCVHGLSRATILIPRAVVERHDRADIELMCAHELAHLRRGDCRLFTATGLARVVFWFNPFIRAITLHTEQAAEAAADGLVLSAGAERRRYAACFVRALRFAATARRAAASEGGVFERTARSLAAVSPSFTPDDREGRRQRLDAILSGGARNETTGLGGRLLSAAGLSLGLAAAMAQAALAVSPHGASLEDAAPGDDALAAAAVDAGAADETLTASLETQDATAPVVDRDAVRAFAERPAIGRITRRHGEAACADCGDGEKTARHNGVDIAAPANSRVRAPADGVVAAAKDRYTEGEGWGRVIVLDHGDGLQTRYAHLGSLEVKAGETVSAGQVIAWVGATGDADKPHVHFEVLQDGEQRDPAPYIGAASAGLDEPPAPPTPPLPSTTSTAQEKSARPAAPTKKTLKHKAPKKSAPIETALAGGERRAAKKKPAGDGWTYVQGSDLRFRLLKDDNEYTYVYELTSPARKSPQRRAEATAKASSFRREFEWSAQDTREAERIVKQAMAQAKREQERVWVEQKRAFEEQKRALTEAKQALREAARERAQDFSEAYRDLDEAYRELFEVELPKGELRRIAKELDKARDQLAAEETAFADTLMKTLERLESQISAMADGADH